MPRVPINYQNTIIYKIVCKNPEVKDCYVGNTTDFIRRKKEHKMNSNNINNDKTYNLKVYSYIRDNNGWNNFEMIEIEKFPCNDGNEARARERYYLEKLNANLNSSVPSRAHSEYRINNTEKIKLYKKYMMKTIKKKIIKV